MMHVRTYRAARETAKLSSGTWKRGDLTVATDVQDDRKGRLDDFADHDHANRAPVNF
jgi:hypothetical protein